MSSGVIHRMEKEVNMPKPKQPPANVIRLVSSNNKPNKPEAPTGLPVPWHSKDVPWHIHIATWALRWRSREDDVFKMLTPQEARFLARMTIWDEAPTENQTNWLNKIADKVETILTIADPNPAA
jgi:hypothetical protein